MSHVDQHYIKIGDLSDTLNITQRTIRYYDQLGLLPISKRSIKGTRLFDSVDAYILNYIRYLQKEKKYSLDDVKNSLFNDDTIETHLYVHSSLLLPDIEISALKIHRYSNPTEIKVTSHHHIVLDTNPERLRQSSANTVLIPTLPSAQTSLILSIIETASKRLKPDVCARIFEQNKLTLLSLCLSKVSLPNVLKSTTNWHVLSIHSHDSESATTVPSFEKGITQLIQKAHTLFEKRGYFCKNVTLYLPPQSEHKDYAKKLLSEKIPLENIYIFEQSHTQSIELGPKTILLSMI